MYQDSEDPSLDIPTWFSFLLFFALTKFLSPPWPSRSCSSSSGGLPYQHPSPTPDFPRQPLTYTQHLWWVFSVSEVYVLAPHHIISSSKAGAILKIYRHLPESSATFIMGSWRDWWIVVRLKSVSFWNQAGPCGAPPVQKTFCVQHFLFVGKRFPAS